MTIAQMANYFDLLQDKFGSPYFTDAEKTVFLRRAHIGFVSDLLFQRRGGDDDSIELSQDTIDQISPLIKTLGYLNMNGSGNISKTNVQTALTTVDADAILWRPLSIGWTIAGDNRPVKFVRHNDWWEFRQNYFKNPSIENPKVREDADNYNFLPIAVNAKIYFTVLKYPIEVDITGNISSDLPDYTHDRIVALALEYAGISSRDEALAQLLQIKK